MHQQIDQQQIYKVIQMSLLTSSNTSKDQLKFLNKMEKYYNKRAGSNFTPKQKLPSNSQLVTKMPSSAVYKIEELMGNFMKQVNGLTQQFQNIDHYNILEILRKHQFFSDVAAVLSTNLHMRIRQLEKSLLQKDAKIHDLKRQIKNYTHSSSVMNQSKHDEISYNPNKDLVSNLYYHARALQQQQFSSFYNKICLSNQIKLQKIHGNPINNNHNNTNDERNQLQLLSEQLQSLIKYSKNYDNTQLIQNIIKTIDQLLSKKIKQCRRPCCLNQGEEKDVRLNKAKTLMNSKISKGGKDFYKNDKSEEYFARYYRQSSFNMQDVTSVARTKRDQMQKIEQLYRKNLKMRSKNSGKHRYSASYAMH